MTKLKWDRKPVASVLNTDYFTNPKQGFDKKWHKKHNLSREIHLGIHQNHEWKPVKLDSGPHAGKIICITCNEKWVAWLPKGSI